MTDPRPLTCTERSLVRYWHRLITPPIVPKTIAARLIAATIDSLSRPRLTRRMKAHMIADLTSALELLDLHPDPTKGPTP